MKEERCEHCKGPLNGVFLLTLVWKNKNIVFCNQSCMKKWRKNEVYKTAGIAADNYKLHTFRKNLKEAGFDWEEIPYQHKTTIMKVKYHQKDFEVLKGIIETSNGQWGKK